MPLLNEPKINLGISHDTHGQLMRAGAEAKGAGHSLRQRPKLTPCQQSKPSLLQGGGADAVGQARSHIIQRRDIIEELLPGRDARAARPHCAIQLDLYVNAVTCSARRQVSRSEFKSTQGSRPPRPPHRSLMCTPPLWLARHHRRTCHARGLLLRVQPLKPLLRVVRFEPESAPRSRLRLKRLGSHLGLALLLSPRVLAKSFALGLRLRPAPSCSAPSPRCSATNAASPASSQLEPGFDGPASRGKRTFMMHARA
jgi:hypothetical protein